MSNSLQYSGFPKVLRNPHFWVILIILTALIILYTKWPWRYWDYQLPWRPWVRQLGNLGLFEFQYKIIGSLFVIPLIYASTVFRWRGTVLTWLVYNATIFPVIISLHLTTESILRNTAFLLFPLALVAIVVFELKWRNNVAQREAERQKFTAEIFKAQEDERRHIALELHDDVIQRLIGMANNAQNHISKLSSNSIIETKACLESLRDMTTDIAEDLRKISVKLRPSVLDNMGLVPALVWLLNNLRKQCHIKTSVSVTGTERKLMPEKEVMIFRIVQEALTNVRRHSKASTVTLSLEFYVTSIKLIVQDNGCGFLIPESFGSFATLNKLGIIGIKERAKLINGSMEIYSQPGFGTTIIIQAKC